jgi:hypothetical protein
MNSPSTPCGRGTAYSQPGRYQYFPMSISKIASKAGSYAFFLIGIMVEQHRRSISYIDVPHSKAKYQNTKHDKVTQAYRIRHGGI